MFLFEFLPYESYVNIVVTYVTFHFPVETILSSSYWSVEKVSLNLLVAGFFDADCHLKKTISVNARSSIGNKINS